MLAFQFYGQNPNCDSSVLYKLLDMNCKPEQVNRVGDTALIYAFKYYGANPNCDPTVFLKLINLLQPLITQIQLIRLINLNTKNHNLKAKILRAHTYNIRRIIINSRISKRVLKSKYDSLSIFN